MEGLRTRIALQQKHTPHSSKHSEQLSHAGLGAGYLNTSSTASLALPQ